MTEELIKSNATFYIRLDGDNEIDASLLSKTIGDMAELTKIAVKEEDPEAYAKLNVTAFRNGSFQIDFSTVCEMLPTIFAGVGVAAGLALTIVNVIKGTFDIKKHVGDKKPKNITDSGNGNVTIENEEGNKILAPKSSLIVINNVKVDQLVMNVANNAREHNPNGSLSFATEKEETVYSPNDLKIISTAHPIEQTSICQRTQVETRLIIKKADIRGKSSWEFLYKDKRISANLNDDEWLERLHNREFKIGFGDAVNVRLEQYIDLDLTGKPIENSERYTVVKIIGDIESEPEQIRF